MLEKKLTKVIFLPFDKNICSGSFYSKESNTFHKDNVGNVFDVFIRYDDYFYIDDLCFHTSRVKIIPKINLPDELFKM